MSFRSGYIAIIGLPNAGKSTLLNRLLGKELCIISNKPQTTRNSILGIRTIDKHQLIFIDSPGWYEGKLKIDKFYRGQVTQTIQDADIVVFVLDGLEPRFKQNKSLIELVRSSKNKEIILVFNKIDRLKQSKMIPLLSRIGEDHPELSEIIPCSAKDGHNVDVLLEILKSKIPEGPELYPEEMYTDKSPSFLMSEFLRESYIKYLDEELPFVLAVVVEDFKDLETRLEFRISVYVERDGQKAILIGPGGALIHQIKKDTIIRARNFFSKKVVLDMWIKVKPNWRQSESILKQIGYKI
ncbi:MAG: GTPase Era [Candidatus Cloacimonadota bacterium]|nr:MAG: GTPase Era [Candidatus Cloacimonadota bacterium]